MAKDRDLDEAKRLMGLGRRRPKPHEEMKVGKKASRKNSQAAGAALGFDKRDNAASCRRHFL